MSIIRRLRWPLFLAYLVAGAVALMMATASGMEILGRSPTDLTFLPATITGLPWSLPLFFFNDGPATTLAVLGICFGLNVGVGLMLAREGGE